MPSKTLLSGTPELVRGLRQFVLLLILALPVESFLEAARPIGSLQYFKESTLHCNSYRISELHFRALSVAPSLSGASLHLLLEPPSSTYELHHFTSSIENILRIGLAYYGRNGISIVSSTMISQHTVNAGRLLTFPCIETCLCSPFFRQQSRISTFLFASLHASSPLRFHHIHRVSSSIPIEYLEQATVYFNVDLGDVEKLQRYWLKIPSDCH
jgi:hypothetical protein